jgi:hypothetical protein
VTPVSAQIGDGDKNVILTIRDTTHYLVASPSSATVNIADKK